MKTLSEIEKCWKEQKEASDGAVALNEAVLSELIRSGIKKEQKMVWEYCIASGFWQWLVYASMIHFIVRFWGDWEFMILCLAVIFLYIPFTGMFINKFRHMRELKFNNPDLQSKDIYVALKTQQKALNDFFNFKKHFDWLNIPVCCAVIVMILYKHGMIPSIGDNLYPGMIVFLIYVSLFITAIYFENRKRFKAPLKKLEMIIREMEEDGSSGV